MLDVLDVFTAFSTLNCVYFVLLLIGVIWAALVLIGGVVADVDLPDVDIDLPGDVDVPSVDFHVDQVPSFDHGSVDVSPLSPITIASFVTSFGSIGLIGTQLLSLQEPISLVFATLGATGIAAATFFFYSKVLIAGQGSSEVRLADFTGRRAEVVIPIPKGGLGQVAIVSRGTRTTRSARSADGEAIPRGTMVTIQAVIGNTVVVSRQ